MGKASKGLLDDDDADNAIEEATLTLDINPEYASRLEHNKQREEWHRLKEKNPRLAAKIEAKAAGADVVESDTDKEEESSDDEEEDEDDLEREAKIDKRFFDVLSKIRQKDQSIYDSTAQLYPESDSDPDSEEGPREKAQPSRKARLKDVLAKQALEGHEGFSSEDEDADAAGHHSQGPTYVQEQQQLRQAFLQEVEKTEGDGGEDDFGNVCSSEGRVLQRQEVEKAEGEEGEDDFGGVLKRRQHAVDAREPQEDTDAGPESTQKLLDDYFGTDDKQLGEEDRFLKKFIANKGWLDKEDEGYQGYGPEDEEDEDYIEKAERFESQYNHRFEEPGGVNIVTYPRNLEGVVRKKDDRRKAQRESHAQRKAEKAIVEQEQVKRMKSVKRREIDERVSRLKEASGSEVAERLLKDIMGKADFDMEEYDKAMAAAFDDEYYEGEDPDLKEQVADEDADVQAALESLPEFDEIEEEDDEPTGDIDVGAEKAALTQLADEYSRMDAEDTVGGVRTRFRYREVPAVDYGLQILDILRAPEKDLNQVVGMKRLAPYREDTGRFRPNMAKLMEMQTAAELARKRERKAPHQRQGFEREQHDSRKPQQDSAQPVSDGDVVAPTKPAPLKQKQKKKDVGEGSKAAAGTPMPVDDDAQQQAASSKKEPKLLKKQKRTAKQEEDAQTEQTEAADGEHVKHKKRKRPEQDYKGVHEQTAEEKAQSRLASFAKPTLAGPSGTSQLRKKRKQQDSEPAQEPEQPEGPKLTKAQRKNLWRAKRRAMQTKE